MTEFIITSSSGEDYKNKLLAAGFTVHTKEKDGWWEAKIQIESLEDFTRLISHLSPIDIIISRDNGIPRLEIYDDYRE